MGMSKGIKGSSPPCVNHPGTPSYARGLCKKCYKQFRYSTPAAIAARDAYVDNYYSTPAGKAKRQEYNRSPKRKALDLARSASPEWKLYLRKRKLAGYGLTLEAYDAMMAAQCGVCAIEGCGRTSDD